MKYAVFRLPLVNPYDDLYACIKIHDNIHDALIDQSEAYSEAATLCKKLAAASKEYKLSVSITSGEIDVTGPDSAITKLINDGVLDVVDESENEYYDEYYDDFGGATD